MINCPQCKSENDETSAFCGDCGATLSNGSTVAQARSTSAYPTMRGLEDFSHADDAAKFVYGKDKKAAAAFSLLIPLGGGQAYNGDFKKILLIIALYLLAGGVDATGLGLLLGLPLGGGVWIWSIFDAYKIAARQKARW